MFQKSDNCKFWFSLLKKNFMIKEPIPIYNRGSQKIERARSDLWPVYGSQMTTLLSTTILSITFFVACKVPGSRSLPREPQQTLNKNKPSTTVSKSVACTTSFANPPSLRFSLSKELCWTSDKKKTTTKRQLTFWRVFWREKVHSGQAGFVLH